MTYNPRRKVGALALGASLLLLAACAPTGATEETKDSIIIGLGAPVTTLDPAATNTVATDLSVIGSIYSRLVGSSSDLELTPDLATSWKQTEPTTWTFELNPDAKFSDGNTVDALAIKWNFDRLLDPNASFRQASAFSSIESVDAVDADTVEIHTKVPDFQLPPSLTSLFMLDPSWAATGDVATEAVGSGPYLLENFGGGEEVVLKANPDYWGDAPAIANVTFRAVPDASARLSAAIAGELDVVAGISPRDVPSIEATDGLAVTSAESTGVSMVKLNTLKAPFDDVRIRQAVNYAVDKQAIIDTLLGGLTSPTSGQVMTGVYDGYFDGTTEYEYNPDRARELLAESGYDGTPVQFTIPSGTYIQAEEIGQAIAAQLQAVGFNTEIQVLPFSVAQEQYLNQTNMAPLYYIRQGVRSITVAGGYKTVWYSTSPYAYWNNPDFDAAVDAAFAAGDENTRNAKLADATQIMRDQAPAIFLFPEPGIAAQQADVNWSIRADSWILPAEMSWS